jgi:D-alanine-D-alanine ligase
MTSSVLQVSRPFQQNAGASIAVPCDDTLQDAIARLLPRLTLVVVNAGSKDDAGAVLHATSNTRSWKSYEAVAHDIARAMGRAGCGRVLVVPEDQRLATRLADSGAALVWLNTGGVQGRSQASHAPSALEMLGMPYIGHEPLAAAMLDNKPVFKRQLQALGIPTARFTAISPGQTFFPRHDARFLAAFPDHKGPFVVKPACGRASQHVHFVMDRDLLPAVVTQVGALSGGTVMIEEYLPGREYCIAVSGRTVSRGGRFERRSQPFVFSALERRLDPGERIFTSMDQRPITAARTRLLDPDTDGDTLDQLHHLAREVFKGFDLDTLIRLDVRADADGRLKVLEANPKPDLAEPTEGVTSLVSIGLAAEGMTYDDLILSLFANRINTAMRDRTVHHAALLQLIEG